MFELFIILALLVLNGAFAMAEIAILSAKKSSLRELATNGDDDKKRGAEAALKLVERPEVFLSTVQVGITLVSVVASAYGGDKLQPYVEEFLKGKPMVGDNAKGLAFVLVVAFITLLSVIVGELAPKSLAIRNSVSIACKTSLPMTFLSKLAFPLVWFLGKITNLLLMPFGKAKAEEDHHRSELMVIVREGVVKGAVQQGEEYLVREAMRFSESVAEEVMVPKPRIVFIHVEDTHAEIVAKIKDSPLRVFPVYEENRDSIIGLVSVESLYAWAIMHPGEPIAWEKITHEVAAVPENQPLDTLYKDLLQTSLGGGLVVDEFGTVRGLVTLNELMEEMFGERGMKPAGAMLQLASGDLGPAEIEARSRPDGRGVRVLEQVNGQPVEIMVDGVAEIDHVVENYFPTLSEEVSKREEPFQTIAGFVMHVLNELPEEGQTFTCGEFEFEVVDMDTLRIDKVKVRRTKPNEVEEEDD